jgi:cytochrome o ubiquinol oxidase subunit II
MKMHDADKTSREQAIRKLSSSLRTGLSALFSTIFIAGCSNVPLLQPRGPVGKSELFVIGTAFALMLIVVIPVIVMAVWFPRRYKASSRREDYDPKWSHSTTIDLVVWLVPAAIVLALGTLTWRESHRLDPFRPIDSAVTPLKVEVVSLDWKWLFIYPELNIASVNQLVIPVDVPISFRLTSDTVMTSFFIPQLGSQIYAMAGRQSRLHLLADKAGVYAGQNQQFSGPGFADMHFKVRAISPRQFAAWVQRTRQTPDKLDLAGYLALREPSANNPPESFSGVRQELFESILNRYRTADRRLATLPAQGSNGKEY